jgi:Na+-driven multidrug efflux pump
MDTLFPRRVFAHLCHNIFYLPHPLQAFMYTGATNLVAAAQEADSGTSNKPATTKVLIGAMQLSTYVGTGLGVILFVFARPLLTAIIGNDAINPAVFASAMKYVRIRALGVPAAAIIGSTQAACLGMQDIRSPLYVLAAAAVVNFFGDLCFVRSTHPWAGGAAGAAWATVCSQYVGLFFFIKWLTHKSSAQSRVVDVSNGSFTVRGFLADRFSFRDLFKLPSAETRKDFSPYLVPVTATQVGKVSGYIAMSHVVASSLGTDSMAAQQILVSLFHCLCPIADSLSLTAQSFLPSIFEKLPSRERSAALRTTALNFVKAGAIFGVAMVSIVAMIPFISGMFTADLAVIALVNSVVPLLLAFFIVHGVLCACEGLLLGQKDLNFLGRMSAMLFFVVPYFLLQVKTAALAGQPVNLAMVWTVFLGYQMFRLFAWVSRVALLQKRTEKMSSFLAEEESYSML